MQVLEETTFNSDDCAAVATTLTSFTTLIMFDFTDLPGNTFPLLVRSGFTVGQIGFKDA